MKITSSRIPSGATVAAAATLPVRSERDEEDEQQATSSSRSRMRPGSRSSNWLQLLLVAAALLQLTAADLAAAANAAPSPLNQSNGGLKDIPRESPTSTTTVVTIPAKLGNGSRGEEIVIPSAAEASTFLPWVGTVNPHIHSSGYDLDVRSDRNSLLVKRSEETMKEYKEFIEKTCRDIENMDLFLVWEHDQFVGHFKKNFAGMDRSRLAEMRAMTQSEQDVPTRLQSICKPPSDPIDWQIEKLTEQGHLENDIVNHVFSNMYKASIEHKIPRKAGAWTPKYQPSWPPEGPDYLDFFKFREPTPKPPADNEMFAKALRKVFR